MASLASSAGSSGVTKPPPNDDLINANTPSTHVSSGYGVYIEDTASWGGDLLWEECRLLGEQRMADSAEPNLTPVLHLRVSMLRF